MSGMLEATILSALQKATTAAVNAAIARNELAASFPVKYVGLTFAIPSNQRYLECVFLPNNIIDQYWDRSRVYRGTYRLLMHWNIDGSGAYPAINALSSVASYFNKEVALASGVRIINEPDMSSIIENGTEIIFPCSMEYRLFQPQ